MIDHPARRPRLALSFLSNTPRPARRYGPPVGEQTVSLTVSEWLAQSARELAASPTPPTPAELGGFLRSLGDALDHQPRDADEARTGALLAAACAALDARIAADWPELGDTAAAREAHSDHCAQLRQRPGIVGTVMCIEAVRV